MEEEAQSTRRDLLAEGFFFRAQVGSVVLEKARVRARRGVEKEPALQKTLIHPSHLPPPLLFFLQSGFPLLCALFLTKTQLLQTPTPATGATAPSQNAAGDSAAEVALVPAVKSEAEGQLQCKPISAAGFHTSQAIRYIIRQRN